MVVGPDWDARPNADDGLGGTPRETDEDGDKLVPNLKRPAMKRVLDTLDSAEDDLDAGATSGMTPKSHMLTNGLGGEGSVWKSPLAETSRTAAVGVIDKITSQVSSTRQDVSDDHSAEPEKVKETDSRATW
ncbi:hypothetical protein ACSL103130_01015 [Actinomyces slackii]|uniref:Uncharacterized protein n=1 Tax=Actinomyces slackii TaxID=52774 RepID=A0A448KAX3_9ACTO|nr:Uncharacterised protein [Actinomyces slackii]